MTDEGFNRWVNVYLDEFLHLGRRDLPNDLIAKAETVLASESDADFRKAFFLGVSSILHANGREEESLFWAQRAVDEFPEDPIVHNSLAMRPLVNPLRDPTREELDKALEANLQALQKARASASWQRYVLSDRCRIAAAAGRYNVVADAMAEILDIWAKPCEPDTPSLEEDWLDKIPNGAVDSSLLEQYRSVTSRQRYPS